jgi:pimeloyl-ACP methyl ester carboxylesterase
MKSHSIKGGAGTRLHAVETGNPKGAPILFIHGISQCSLTWIRQLDSELARSYRLVAMDMRGHGLSEKPREGYTDSRLWADDVRAVMKELNLDHPVLCGWSYGPLVILDYLRHYGEDDIRAINFVGGVTKLGSEEAAAVLTPDFLKLIPGFFSADAEESALSLGSLIQLCFAEKLSTHDRYRMLGYNLSVPAYVRQAMFSRALDNDDLLPRLRKPALITHGIDDRVVKPTVIDQQMSRIDAVKIRMMATGHGCFWDDAPGYNRSLAEFVASL